MHLLIYGSSKKCFCCLILCQSIFCLGRRCKAQRFQLHHQGFRPPCPRGFRPPCPQGFLPPRPPPRHAGYSAGVSGAPTATMPLPVFQVPASSLRSKSTVKSGWFSSHAAFMLASPRGDALPAAQHSRLAYGRAGEYGSGEHGDSRLRYYKWCR